MRQKNFNRRDFFRLSAATGAGVVLASGSKAQAMVPYAMQADTAFPLRKLGSTGLTLPILSMGVMRADNPNVVRAAYNSGITHFDTAHGYQNGRNEEMLGNFFKDKPRSSFTIATKGKFDYPLKDSFEKDFTALLDLSLKRLQMDYVDLFYTHALDSRNGTGDVTDERILSLLKQFVASGKVKHVGLSTHAMNPAQIDAAISVGLYKVILLSYNFKMPKMQETNEAIERGVKAGIGFVAMKSMTGGVADGKAVNGQACLKWVWQNPNITTAIPGFDNFDKLDDCLAAARSPELSADESSYLASLDSRDMLFCNRCGKCEKECKEGLPVPEMMRAYMYAYGYRNAGLSKELLSELRLADAASMCSSCNGSCRVKCSLDYNVAERIAAVTPVLHTPDILLS
ncbi:MAG: aldo/keto reductase [Tannerellaceae bacterium]|jgi:aryl-alcohol dehydrogenase-like predicted oxidoreductase|nr:aldo/keto reductase [Tannerellaceae bacterium]